MHPRKVFRLALARRSLRLGERTLLMGVLNVTPDSFSDGGRFATPGQAAAQALAMQAAGADLIDIGAESTRPGSHPVPAAEELERLLPVLAALRGKLKVPISVDTRKAAVAEMAVAAGAEILNDISGLRFDPRLAQVAARAGAALILMHSRGTPLDRQKGPFARNAVRDVVGGLRRSVAQARRAGVMKSRIVIDPGIGFGKTFRQNLELLAALPTLGKLGFPVLVGTSRKGFLGGKGPQDRVWGTAATVTASILNGAHIVRVHDVPEMVQVARMADRLRLL